MRNGLNWKSCCQKRKWDVLALICAELSAALSWRALPCAFGKWNSVYRYFCRLQQRGESRLHFCQSTSPWIRRKKGLERHIGKSKGGNNTKIHAAVDKQCRPIKLFLSAGNVNDIKVAPNLLERLSFDLTIIMADKAYCSRKFLRLIESKGGSPCKKTYKRPWEIEQYKKRNVVERFFQRLKENHRLAMRFDKRADRFFSFVLFASILLWLK